MKSHWLKIGCVFAFSLLFRLLPFRPPNVELILTSQMPVAKAYGALAGFSFGALSVLVFDLLTGTLGPWSLITAPTYGILGLFAGWYFKNRGGRKHFVYFAIAGTLFYDAITGLSIGPLFFGQSFAGALFGQVPFTLMHLLGNVSFALVLSPYLERVLTVPSSLFLEKSGLSKIQDPHKTQNPKTPNDTIRVCPSV